MWNFILIQRGSNELWPGDRFWLCVHCDLELGNMTLATNHDTPFGQHMWKILSTSNMGLRSYGPDKTWTCIQLDGQGDRQTDSQGDITPWTLFAVGIISKLICIKQNVFLDIRNIVLKYILNIFHYFPCLKLIEIVILWVYHTIPFGFSLFRHFLVITFQFCILHVWLRITDEGSVPEMRIWSISLI